MGLTMLEQGPVTRVAAVQALAHTGADEYRNLELAERYAEEAAEQGAGLVVFPECFPGPATGPMDWGGRLAATAEEQLEALARRLGVHIAAGGLEPCATVDGAFHVAQRLYGPDGRTLCHYRRVQPDNGDLNAYFFAGRRDVVPGDEIPVVPTSVGRIGLQVCGELFVPEISRVQMLGGAQILLAPVNGRAAATRLRGMWQTWQHIARARAAENLLYVVVAQKFLVDGPGGGIGLIAGPESMLARSAKPGVLVADLDLDRLDWLRSRVVDDELLQPPESELSEPTSAARCGQQADRRPELYGALVEPQKDAFDYFKFDREAREK
jgi:predicted amidohydrolase